MQRSNRVVIEETIRSAQSEVPQAVENDNKAPKLAVKKQLTCAEAEALLREADEALAEAEKLSCTDSAERPQSGPLPGVAATESRGALTITNGTNSDAVAVLFEVPTETPTRAIYVRSGDKATTSGVPAGNYWLRFQLGSNWLVGRRFCAITGTAEFEKVLSFSERERLGSVEYNSIELTLHAVRGGTAKTDKLPNVPLALPQD
jgi:hypothetical protein